MSKFTFQNTDEDGTVVTVEFEAEVWLDAFPKFLQLCRGSGFVVDEGTALYAPTASKQLFGDRDFLLFDSDFEKCNCIEEPTNPCCEVSKGDFEPCVHMNEDGLPKSKTLEQWVAEGHNPQRSNCYYDFNRNK